MNTRELYRTIKGQIEAPGSGATVTKVPCGRVWAIPERKVVAHLNYQAGLYNADRCERQIQLRVHCAGEVVFDFCSQEGCRSFTPGPWVEAVTNREVVAA